jgi:hypothetical protein
MQWDPSGVSTVATWAGYAGTRNGAAGAVTDLFGDKKNVIATGAGPDSQAATSLHRLLRRLEGADPFPLRHGVNPGGRGRKEICPLGFRANAQESAGGQEAAAGSPWLAAAILVDEVASIPIEWFRDVERFERLRAAAQAIVAPASVPEVRTVDAMLDAFCLELPGGVLRVEGINRLQSAADRVRDRCAAWVRNSAPSAVIGTPAVARRSGERAEVTLDGSQSRDVDSPPLGSDIMDWRWSVDGVYVGSGPTITTFVKPGVHDATLSIVDTVGHAEVTTASFDVP